MLYCCFTSKQPVQVKWYKDDIPLKIGAKYQFDENNQVFSIVNGSKLDNGAYRCEGSNQHGRQSWSITVSIRRKDFFINKGGGGWSMPPCYQRPTVYSLQTNVTVKKGTNATLTCIVQLEKDCSAQAQAFYWRNPQGRIMIKNTNTLTSTGRNKDVLMKITIKDVKKSQIGTYKCIARNAHGKSSSGVWLNVE
ncbi:Hemicentin-1 [Paramuricea clavata]|uniref:Hemicentin-1 n=1 Tax=Paramuricea clavata TaxID=317549 RepID=A0A6S7JAJ5_PARCT|nr:Hemicentin-1 [Paramuricea clavata]